jgi:hypothetical protein
VTSAQATEHCELGKLLADDLADDDGFGGSLSLDGDRAVAGASRKDDGADDAGAAYVFRREGDDWVQEARLLSLYPQLRDYFGYSVSISGDRVAVGAPGTDLAGEDAGAVYIFRREDTNWVVETILVPSDVVADLRIGIVDLDGDRLVVGAPLDMHAGHSSGSVYVFRREGTRWIEEAKLTASDATEWDYFGAAVAIDRGTVVVGAYGIDGWAGAAYVFRRSGNEWLEEAKLVPSDPRHYMDFAQSVAISGDTIVAGRRRDGEAARAAGAAYVFRHDGGVWNEEAKLVASDAAYGVWFGNSVAIDGMRVLIGAAYDDDVAVRTGSSYVFARQDEQWVQRLKLTASAPEAGDEFGHRVDISGDLALIGAIGDDDGARNAGSVYVFSVTGEGCPDGDAPLP